MQIETIYSLRGGLYDRISIMEDLDYILHCDDPEYRKKGFRTLHEFLLHLETIDGPKLWGYLHRSIRTPGIHFWTDELLGNPATHDLAPNCPSQLSIEAIRNGGYRIEYLLPHERKPWSRQLAFATGAHDAAELMLDGLRLCEDRPPSRTKTEDPK